MSHFSVAVFSRRGDDVEFMLEPFCENVEPGSDFAEFVEDEECDIDEITGEKGYWHNPVAKWDWYSIGGRFSGLLVTKDGELVDQARVRECAFERDQDEYDRAIRFWEVHVEGKPLADGEEKDRFDTYYKPEYYIDQYRTKENYADECSRFGTYAFLTADGEWNEPGEMRWFGFANTTAESRDEYRDAFRSYLKKAHNEDMMITIVDCHI